MPNDTLTLSLNGEVSLSAFADSIHHLNDLIVSLSEELCKDAAIEWTVEELQAGSATATVRGLSDDITRVERVVNAYTVIGRALANQEPVPFSDRVQRHAAGLVKTIDGNVISVQFETAYGDALVATPPLAAGAETGITRSLGVVKGYVETLTRRRGLRFVLYDLIFDWPIYCYLRKGQEDEMRGLWGKKVAVAGRLERKSGRPVPVSVVEISNITTLEEVPPGSFKHARGILPAGPNDELPEQILRRLRDA